MRAATPAHRLDPAQVAATKGAATVSVCLPARDEEATVGQIVAAVRAALVDQVGLVDEVLVVDDHSTDGTARVAAAAGARVVSAADAPGGHGSGPGKGRALWASLHAAGGDVVAWCDADIVDFDPAFVTGLVAPLLADPAVVFVKGHYDRPLTPGTDGGGRVTELVARPLLSLLFPHLADAVQPLSGEYAGRRHALEAVPFAPGYGVDIGLLIDLAHRFGTDAMAQVDLGVRRHRNRTLDQLGPQAAAVAQAALRRADPALVPEVVELVRPGRAPVKLDGAELPPLAELAPELR